MVGDLVGVGQGEALCRKVLQNTKLEKVLDSELHVASD